MASCWLSFVRRNSGGFRFGGERIRHSSTIWLMNERDKFFEQRSALCVVLGGCWWNAVVASTLSPFNWRIVQCKNPVEKIRKELSTVCLTTNGFAYKWNSVVFSLSFPPTLSLSVALNFFLLKNAKRKTLPNMSARRRRGRDESIKQCEQHSHPWWRTCLKTTLKFYD